jgi:hypothetical protein
MEDVRLVRRRKMAERDDDALLRRAMSVLGRRSASKLTAKERTERGQKAAQVLWANLTTEERSVEMKRRAAVRKRNRARKKK